MMSKWSCNHFLLNDVRKCWGNAIEESFLTLCVSINNVHRFISRYYFSWGGSEWRHAGSSSFKFVLCLFYLPVTYMKTFERSGIVAEGGLMVRFSPNCSISSLWSPMLVTYSKFNAWTFTGEIYLTMFCCLLTINAIFFWWFRDSQFVVFAFSAFATDTFIILC